MGTSWEEALAKAVAFSSRQAQHFLGDMVAALDDDHKHRSGGDMAKL